MRRPKSLKKRMHKEVDLVFITLSSPILVGVYEDNILIESISSSEKSSDVLPKIFDELSRKYEIKKLFYANGPGSFMAIKIAYIFLKSISILKNIPLFATDAFYFNKNQPIKAIGKLFFVKISSEIKTQKLEIAPEVGFMLPDVLEYSGFSTAAAPLYGIGAVG
jgi:hypothetical protein